MWPNAADRRRARAGASRWTRTAASNGTSSASYPSVWYAFDQGSARFYVLDASWADGNNGTATTTRTTTTTTGRRTAPSTSGSQRDLAAHPGAVKFAFFHYPLYVDERDRALRHVPAGRDQPRRAAAHERRRPCPSTATRTSTSATSRRWRLRELRHRRRRRRRPSRVNHCSSLDAYAIGWSVTPRRAARAARASSRRRPLQFHHFLLVTVNGSQVTVTPTDATGRTFDVKTYDFSGPPPPPPPDTTPPTAPGNVTATAANPTRVDVNWTASTDNLGVEGYNITRDGALVASVTSRHVVVGHDGHARHDLPLQPSRPTTRRATPRRRPRRRR